MAKWFITVDSETGELPELVQDALDEKFQASNADLEAIASLSTTEFGRGLLALANAAALRAILELGSAAEADTTDFDAAGSAAAAQAASQPLNTDLSAIASLSTTEFGRGLLTLANQAALNTAIGLANTSTPGLVELATNTEATAGSSTTLAVTPAGVSAAVTEAINALLDSAPSQLNTLKELADALGNDANFASTITAALAGKQPLDATLSALAGVTVAANKLIYANGEDSFTTTDLTAFGRTLIDDADAATARATLGLGTLSTLSSITYDHLPPGSVVRWYQSNTGTWWPRPTNRYDISVDYIGYFGMTTLPEDFVPGIDSYTYRSAD